MISIIIKLLVVTHRNKWANLKHTIDAYEYSPGIESNIQTCSGNKSLLFGTIPDWSSRLFFACNSTSLVNKCSSSIIYIIWLLNHCIYEYVVLTPTTILISKL